MQPFHGKTTRSTAKSAIRVAAASLILGSASTAQAQDFDPRTPLENRPRPDYANEPIILGGFEVRPQIEGGLEYIDNVFAANVANADDVVLSFRPSVTATDQRTDRRLNLRLATGYQTFLANRAEDRFQLQASANARFGIGTATRPFGGANFNLNDTSSLQLATGDDVTQAFRTLSYGANLGLEQDIGSFTVEGEGRTARYEYQGLVLFGDDAFESGIRDNTFYEGRGRIAYSTQPDQRYYVEGRLSRFDFGDQSLTDLLDLPEFFLSDRSVDITTVVGGVQFQITELLSLDANLGYARIEYDNPAEPGTNALSASASVYYSPTRLTRFQLRASRDVDDTINPLFASFLRTGVALTAEHELLRNLLMRSDLRYASFESSEDGQIGEEVQFSGVVNYFLNPKISLGFRGEYFERSGFAAGNQTRFRITAAYRF